MTIEEQYREAAICCMRFLGIRTLAEVDRITIPEYKIMLEAAKLRNVDLDYRNHLQAFLNFSVQAQKKVGKNKTQPVYRRFNKFYDYEEEIKKARAKKKNPLSGVINFLKAKGGEGDVR